MQAALSQEFGLPQKVYLLKINDRYRILYNVLNVLLVFFYRPKLF